MNTKCDNDNVLIAGIIDVVGVTDVNGDVHPRPGQASQAERLCQLVPSCQHQDSVCQGDCGQGSSSQYQQLQQ